MNYKTPLYLFYLLISTTLLSELGLRIFYAHQFNSSLFFSTKDLLYSELQPRHFKNYDPNAKNVLLLGASTLSFDHKAGVFADAFPNSTIYSVASLAHSSRDSLLKYKELIDRGYHFQYVVFMHGLNELRFNRQPPEIFYDDYSHVPFYQYAKEVFEKGFHWRSLLMKTVLGFKILTLSFSEPENPYFSFQNSLYHPTHSQNGFPQLQTEKTFKKNLETIIALVKKDKATLIVPAFTYNIPLNYSDEDFEKRKLGYSYIKNENVPIKVWGPVAYVQYGLKRHNDIIYELKDQFLWIDTKSFSSDISNFSDVCHHSEKGKKEFGLLLKKALNASILSSAQSP